jgi:phosphoribosylglycinamide formyltransferase-1
MDRIGRAIPPVVDVPRKSRSLRLGVLASGKGSIFRRFLDDSKAGDLDAKVCVVISNNSDSGAMNLGRQNGIPAIHISSKTHPNWNAEQAAIAATLVQNDVDLVLLAGFMKKVGGELLRVFRGRVLNVHPALLPDFGGTGMYGRHVHEVVLASGISRTGATIHLVEEEYDSGYILAQASAPVHSYDTVEMLEERVQTLERDLYVETVRDICAGRIQILGIPNAGFLEPDSPHITHNA